MYARTSFMGAKNVQIWKKGVFLVILTNFEKDMTDKLRKTHTKTRIYGLFVTLPHERHAVSLVTMVTFEFVIVLSQNCLDLLVTVSDDVKSLIRPAL